MFKFNSMYFSLTIAFFLVEVLIALFVHDDFIRPYVGDVLVVILMYCFFKSFLVLPVFPVALSVLAFAFLIETLQGFNMVEKLGLEASKLATVVLGNSFSWVDILCYLAGIGFVLIIDVLLAYIPMAYAGGKMAEKK